MTAFRANVVANFAGQAWILLLQFAVVPIYLRFLGVEAFGMIGLFATLSVTLQLFDMGLAQTLNREVARYSADPAMAKNARDLLRTLETIYWGIGLALGTVVFFAGPRFFATLISADQLPHEAGQAVIRLMALALILQWPLNLYQGGLAGLQKLILLNTLRISLSTFTAVGAVLTLWLVEPSVRAFFTWQIFAACISLLFTVAATWRSLRRAGQPPKFHRELLRGIGRFATGMGLLNIMGMLLGQSDKWLVATLVSLKSFGFYTVAVTVSSAVAALVGPIQGALFPRLSMLAARGDQHGLKTTYHAAAQLAAVVVFPAAMTLSLFSSEVLLLWTGSAEVARESGPIVSLLVAGTGLNGVMFVPYTLQIAHGWFRLPLMITISFLVTMIPAMAVATLRYGAAGAAAVWLGMNVCYVLVGVPLTHSRLLRGGAKTWFLDDVGPVFLATLGATGIVRALTPHGLSGVLTFSAVAAAGLTGLIAAVLSAREIRQRLVALVR